MEYKETIFRQATIPYLKKFGIAHDNSTPLMIECPQCHAISCDRHPHKEQFSCKNPTCSIKGKIFNLSYIVKCKELDKVDWTVDQVLDYLVESFNLVTSSPKQEADLKALFDFYHSMNWAIAPVERHGKACIETDWQNNEHRDPDDYVNWIEQGLNIAVRTGEVNNITIVDIDCLNNQEAGEYAKLKRANRAKKQIKDYQDRIHIPEEVAKIMGDPLIQSTGRGFHLIYEYEPDLRKTELSELIFDESITLKIHVDIENNLGLCMLQPSVVDVLEVLPTEDVNKTIKRKTGFLSERSFVELKKPSKMPDAFKQVLLASIPRQVKSKADLSPDAIDTKLNAILSDVQIKTFTDGDGRNSLLLGLVGLLRSRYGTKECENFMQIVNKFFFKPELPYKDLRNMLRSLEGYNTVDYSMWEERIINHLREVEDASARDILQALALGKNEDKALIDIRLTSLVRQGKIKKMGNRYSVREIIQWDSKLFNSSTPIKFKMPYFESVNRFDDGNIVLIGATTGTGKTICAMNFVHRLVIQGIKPYYFGTESDSGFIEAALKLGLRDDSFYFPREVDDISLMDLELVPNSVTIIDWIDPSALGENGFAAVNQIFRHLKTELRRKRGIAIVFMQLKDNFEWFSTNLVKNYPALAAKYLYVPGTQGKETYWEFFKHRKGRLPGLHPNLPCRYIWETKEVKLLSEIESNNEKLE